MKAAVWYGENDIRVEEREKPSPEKGKVLIRVRAAGICGTDLMIYGGKFPRSRPPLVPGHEFVGEVVTKNDIPSDLKTGDHVAVNPLISCGHCVACRMGFPHVCKKLRLIGVDVDGAFAEYVTASWEKVFRIPTSLSYEIASLIEPTAVAVHVVARSALTVGDYVVVLGGGPIGLLIAMVARIAGASRIFVTEVLHDRLKLGACLGFEAVDASDGDVTARILRKMGGRGADIVFDAAGVPQTSGIMVSLIRPRGRIVLVGLHKQQASVDLFNTSLKEAEIVGSRVYSQTDFEKAINLITSGRLVVDSLVTHRLSLDDVGDGLRLLAEGGEVVKVVLSP